LKENQDSFVNYQNVANKKKQDAKNYNFFTALSLQRMVYIQCGKLLIEFWDQK